MSRHKHPRFISVATAFLSLVALSAFAAAPAFGQLSLTGTSGSTSATFDFRGNVTYNLSGSGGAAAGTFPGHDFSIAQAATTPGTVNFSYPANPTFDQSDGTTGRFRINFNYTNNTGLPLQGFDITFQGTAGFYSLGAGYPARGVFTDSAGPAPTFAGLASGTRPNGDALSYQVNGLLVWDFATPLPDGGTYGFYIPVQNLSTANGGTFDLKFQPLVPEPTAPALLLAGLTLVLRRPRRRPRS